MNDYEPAEQSSASDGLPIDELVVPLTGPEGQGVSFKLPIESFWLAFCAAEKLELDETLDLINFAWKLLRDLAQQGVTNVENALTEIAPLLADPLALAHTPGPEEQPSQEESLLKLSYKLLRERYWSSAESAWFAAEKLGRPVSSDEWWRRVVRWAAQHNLPPLE
jgi:hypothetical protein